MHKNSRGPAAAGRREGSELVGRLCLQGGSAEGLVCLNAKVPFLCPVIPILGVAGKQYDI